MTDLLAVGYRRPAVTRAGLVPVILLVGTACTGLAAVGAGSVYAVVGLVGCAAATLLIVPLYLRAVVRALRGAPLLTLDRDGVTLHSARIRLPWSNVAQIRIGHIGHGPAGDTLVFVPADESRVIAELRGLRRRFARDGIRRLGGPIFVRVDQLESPLDEVLAAARRWSAAPVRHHHSLGRHPVRIRP
jgi:hypothetical protein